MTTLTMGANTALTSDPAQIDIFLPRGVDIDVTALQTYPGGKVRGDGDMCFYNQPSISGGAVALERKGPDHAVFTIATGRIAADVEKIVLTATIDTPGKSFGDLGNFLVEARGACQLPIDTAGRSEAALILAEVYRRNGMWKIRHVAQGFNGGLKALAEHFGVEIADAAPTPSPAPAPAPTPSPSPAASPRLDVTRTPKVSRTPDASKSNLNLSKINLTKQDSTISLKKNDGKFGKISVNLNWNQRPRSSGLFGLKSSAIDLDLGALVEDVHGNVTAVQALGNSFGDYHYFPYVKLLGDDRTGAVSDGEWLEINGDQWGEIHRVLIFAFIYDGAPNWAETDGVVRVMAPGQPEIEVRMNEFGSNEGMCAVAYLENKGGQIKVSREVNFYRGHSYMDDAYGWGMNWRAGRK
jgi:tellurite resistance protein TerA